MSAANDEPTPEDIKAEYERTVFAYGSEDIALEQIGHVGAPVNPIDAGTRPSRCSA